MGVSTILRVRMLDEVSIEEPFSILSASIQHPLKPFGGQYFCREKENEENERDESEERVAHPMRLK